MTGEQKPGGLEVVAWRWTLQEWGGLSVWYHSTTKPRPKATERVFNLQSLTPAEPAEARIRELEREIEILNRRLKPRAKVRDTWEARATAAEAKLARAVEGLERIANGEPYFAAGSLRDEARQTLAALHPKERDHD